MTNVERNVDWLIAAFIVYHSALLSLLSFLSLSLLSYNPPQLNTPRAVITASFSFSSRGCFLSKPFSTSIASLYSIALSIQQIKRGAVKPLTDSYYDLPLACFLRRLRGSCALSFSIGFSSFFGAISFIAISTLAPLSTSSNTVPFRGFPPTTTAAPMDV